MYSRVYVEITNICNMACSFCHGHSRPLGRMSREAFARTLEALQGHTEYIYYHLMGEPLTHPLLPEFMEMARQKGFRSVLTTNGTLLKKRMPELLAARPHKVSISLHSFEEGAEAQREAYLREAAEYAAGAAATGTIVVFRLWNRGVDEEGNRRTLELLARELPGPWTENSRGLRLRERVFLEWGDRFQWPDREAEDLGQEVFCYGLRDHFGVLWDGTVVPCCLDAEGAIPLGNLFHRPLEEILGSPRARAMAEGFSCRRATEELCRRCGYARRF